MNIRTIAPCNNDQIVIQEGDIYEWIYDVECRSGRTQYKGTSIKIEQRTKLVPHKEISFSGWNWFCKEHTGHISVWATLEGCIQRGLLKKIAAETSLS